MRRVDTKRPWDIICSARAACVCRYVAWQLLIGIVCVPGVPWVDPGAAARVSRVLPCFAVTIGQLRDLNPRVPQMVTKSAGVG